MKRYFRPRWWAVGLCLLATGCTSLREIPRSEYAAEPQRDRVRLVTQDGLAYEFDYVQVAGDSLTGFRRRDTPGPVDDYATVQVALEDVSKLETRGINWTRTGLIGGGLVAALLAKGLGNSNSSSSESNGGSGGSGGRVP